MQDCLPPYVYRNAADEATSLLQGDILKVEDKFKEYFKEFYPKINHPDNEEKYVMVLTQSCDLVKNQKRQPNACSHGEKRIIQRNQRNAQTILSTIFY